MKASILFLIFLCGTAILSGGQTTVQNGSDSQWPSAGKQAVGTSANGGSKIWFTLANGMLTEVFYPQVDTANVNSLQFIVVNPKTKKIETERDDATHKIIALKKDSLSFQQINTAKSGEWTITKSYTTDPEQPSVLIDVKFESRNKDLNLYVYFDPSLNNSGMGDTATSTIGLPENTDTFTSEETGKIVAAIRFSSPLAEQSSGFAGTSDPLEQIREFGFIKNRIARVENGNVLQAAKIIDPQNFTVVLSFAENTPKAFATAAMSMKKGFSRSRKEYDKGWAEYVKRLPKVDAKYSDQFKMAAMVIKAQEDKTYHGGSVASLSTPWGGGNNGNGTTSGYHLVWSRDLYHVATAFMALGDNAAALRSLDYLFKYQQREDGSFPQITWLDGRLVGDSIQLDEVSYPLILAYQLGKTDKATYEKNIKPSAEYLHKNGPRSQQERWEEEAGFSPSTIAAEIAGLVCSAEIAKLNGDTASAERWLKTADNWAANIEKWTATTTGKYGDGKYYLRISANGTPDAGDKIELNNGAGSFDERDIVDAGFLELVRFGIKRADDPLIKKSIEVTDKVLKVKTPNGDGWYRYNNDGYGENFEGQRWNWDTTWRGKGHLWVLLAGERGQYEIAQCGLPNAAKDCLAIVNERLETMMRMSGDAMMIPEQVWSRPEILAKFDPQFMPPLVFGEGNGSATPLAWSMAQFIRLTMNLQKKKNIEMPDVVYKRYAGAAK